MGWFLLGLVVGWFVPQPDWKKVGTHLTDLFKKHAE